MLLHTREFYGLQIVDESKENWYQYLISVLTKSYTKTTIVMTPNPEQLVRARMDGDFWGCLQAVDLLLPDGQGLVWAAGCRERLTGSDTLVELIRVSQEKKLKLLLIGGRYEATGGQLTVPIESGQTRLYYTSGYKNVKKILPTEQKALELLISGLKPDIVAVLFGAPAQEKWLIDNRALLARAQVKIALAAGGSLDFLMGTQKRAPQMWQKLKLEWLWRLIREPWRWRRQLALGKFVWWQITGAWQARRE